MEKGNAEEKILVRKHVTEKRGNKWAFTEFGVEVRGKTEEEMKNGKGGETE